MTQIDYAHELAEARRRLLRREAEAKQTNERPALARVRFAESEVEWRDMHRGERA